MQDLQMTSVPSYHAGTDTAATHGLCQESTVVVPCIWLSSYPVDFTSPWTIFQYYVTCLPKSNLQLMKSMDFFLRAHYSGSRVASLFVIDISHSLSVVVRSIKWSRTYYVGEHECPRRPTSQVNFQKPQKPESDLHLHCLRYSSLAG